MISLIALIACVPEFPEPPKRNIVDVPTEDFDGDGFSELEGDVYPDGTSADNDNEVYPGADDVCDGKDNDLNGHVDDDSDFQQDFYTDFDQDGFGVNDTFYTACEAASNVDIPFAPNKNDCDDGNPMVYPGSLDLEGSGCYLDADEDGYGDVNAVEPYDKGSDCDDGNAELSPQAFEICDEIDNNCDGVVDEDSAVNAPVWYYDSDGDGFGVDEALPSRSCTQPEGYSNLNTDCDDTNANVNPSALEYCNQVDDNCDGDIDEGENNTAPVDAPTWYLDSDNDGYGFEQASIRICLAPENYIADNTDCNDSDSSFHPNASEVCNGLDEDCDGIVDEEALDATIYYADTDQDGFGNANDTLLNCSLPNGFVLDSTDCNDQNSNISPDSDEYCNGIDEDCDEEVDENALDRIVYYEDSDGDTFGNPEVFELFCQLPEGYVANNFDCDDSNEEHYPNAVEYCDEVDNNCDGVVDENSSVDAIIYYQDTDNDGYGVTEIVFQSCSTPDGYSSQDGDCDDNDGNQRPEGIEICNGEDDDCDGLSDENAIDDPQNPAIGLEIFYLDGDGDGHGSIESANDVSLQYQGCPQNGQTQAPEGYAWAADDCDDTDENISPSLIENCDEVDRNCDGDPRLGATDVLRWYVDSDEDGYGNPDIPFDSCLAPVGFIAQAGDCDDLDANANPEGVEICNGKLDDCDSGTELINGRPLNESDDDNDGYVECELDVDILNWSGQEGVIGGSDCDDSRSTSFPGSMFDATILECMFDGDGDGYGDADPPEGFDVGTDCDDENINRYVGAIEICNGVYDDCEGYLLDASGIPPREFDDDEDGFVECEGLGLTEWNGQSGLLGDGDCDDTDVYTYPGAAYLTSETECLRDATDLDGTGGPDGYADCRYGDCEYSYFQDVENGVAIDFVKVTRGESTGLVHDFYMSSTEITMGSYTEIVGVTPYEECNLSYDIEENYQQPVHKIGIHRARKMANLLSEQKGFETCYDCTGSLTDTRCYLKEDYVSASYCKGYRIPSNTEIGRARKPDQTTDFWTADGGGNIPDGGHYDCENEVYLTNTSQTPVSSFAWYCYNSENYPNDVGLLNPITFGLYDLYGNLLDIADNGYAYGGSCRTNSTYNTTYGLTRAYNILNENQSCDYIHQTMRLVRSTEDSAPTKVGIQLTPSEPVVDETDLVCEVSNPSIDPDGEEITYIFEFYVDDILYEGETSSTYLEGDTVPSQYLTEKQNWICKATPSDGTLMGETVGSSNYVEPFIRGGCVNYDCDFGITLDAKEDMGMDFKMIPTGTDPLGRYELTYDFFLQVDIMQRLTFKEIEGYNPPDLCNQSNYAPARNLSWHQMARFTNTLSDREGFEQCYDCENLTLNAYCETASEFVTDGIHTCEGYRLPTHAELEYAQRAGTEKDFWTPHGGADLLSYQLNQSNVLLDDGVGTYLKDYVYCYRNETSPRLPNGFGIYDINGLYYDMAHDSAGCDYPNGYTNPVCDDSTQMEHVHVGGHYDQRPYQVVNGIYGSAEPTCTSYAYSFRLARTIVE